MMKRLLFVLVFFSLIGCSKDDDSALQQKFVAAFEQASLQIDESGISKEIKIVFSSKASRDGSLTITYSSNQVLYGAQNNFTTLPSGKDGILEIPVEAGSSSASFSYQSLSLPTGEGNTLTFSISKINMPQAQLRGNTKIELVYGKSVLPSGHFAPKVGGPNEPNQVFVDLSSGETKVVQRDKWDLGFYSGNGFHVTLNGALYMFAAPLETNNLASITAVSVNELQSKMDFLTKGSQAYVDAPKGNIQGSVINNISANDAENPVYLVKLGYEIGTNTPQSGSVAISGEMRGWKKIRVLRSEQGGYILRYADLNDTDYQQIRIPKKPGHNFTYFSFNLQSIVSIAPQTWDLKFTTFTEVLDLPSGGKSAYGFADYAATNVLNKVKAYQVKESEVSYLDFTSSMIEESKLKLSQRAIGANWRDVFEGLYPNRFYVLKDSDGHFYKIKFTAFVNEQGERGHPEFKYELLN